MVLQEIIGSSREISPVIFAYYNDWEVQLMIYAVFYVIYFIGAIIFGLSERTKFEKKKQVDLYSGPIHKCCICDTIRVEQHMARCKDCGGWYCSVLSPRRRDTFSSLFKTLGTILLILGFFLTAFSFLIGIILLIPIAIILLVMITPIVIALLLAPLSIECGTNGYCDSCLAKRKAKEESKSYSSDDSDPYPYPTDYGETSDDGGSLLDGWLFKY
jgi:multisubunit Na+/H+ antiporter MnhG subunit